MWKTLLLQVSLSVPQVVAATTLHRCVQRPAAILLLFCCLCGPKVMHAEARTIQRGCGGASTTAVRGSALRAQPQCEREQGAGRAWWRCQGSLFVAPERPCRSSLTITCTMSPLLAPPPLAFPSSSPYLPWPKPASLMSRLMILV